MNEYFRIILVAILALVGGIISYLYQSWRNRRIEYKGRVQILYNLIKEAFIHAETQINAFKTLITTVHADDTSFPIVHAPALNNIKFLSQKMLSDEYFIAFNRLLNNCINSKKFFFDLKYSSTYLDSVIDQMIDMCKQAVENDTERRKQFIAQYKNLKSVFKEIAEKQIDDENDKNIQSNVDKILVDFLDNREENDGKGNLNELINKFVMPIINEIKGSANNDFVSLMMALTEMYSLYREIKFQNAALVEDLNEYIPECENSINKLKEVYNNLSNSQVKPVFEEV